jgi:hypothetical protein
MSGIRKNRRALVATILLVDVAATVTARLFGYGVGGNAIVRCRRGHLFTTIWVPGVSLKSVRLGWWRIQRCPVGPHWSVVVPVRAAELTAAERETARRRKDFRIP